jgi:biopolymer transport protein ExbD
MAEITSDKSHKKPTAGAAKSKKLSTRVDLTPMVDLGFLLITFFIFTTTTSQSAAMKIVIPDDKGNAMPTKEGGALTLLPAANARLYYYEGRLESTNLKVINLKEMRDLIIDKKRRTLQNDLFVIIKPAKTCVYRDIVNVLDEMTINDIKRYAITDITMEEETLMK